MLWSAKGGKPAEIARVCFYLPVLLNQLVESSVSPARGSRRPRRSATDRLPSWFFEKNKQLLFITKREKKEL